MTNQFQGGCGCGAVRYHFTSAPMFVNCCHCTRCQQETGSAFAVNAVIELDRLVVEKGTLETADVPTDSGRAHQVFKCAQCALILWNAFGDWPMRFVRVGTLDDPSALVPGAHIFTRSKQPWVVLPEGAPSFDAFYEPPKVWPPESLVRFQAMMG